MIFLVLSGKMVFFSGKYNFSLVGKWKMIFLKKYMEIWYFLYICINVTNMIFSRKNKLKDDWHSRLHSRKSSNDSLYGDLNRRFHVFLCDEKNKTRNLIYRIKIWLLLQFIWLEIFYIKEFSIHCTIQPSRVVFRGVLEHQLRKLFVHYEMGYKSKKIRAAVKIYSVQVNWTFLKVHTKNLVKATRIGEVTGRKRSRTLRNLSFKIRY